MRKNKVIWGALVGCFNWIIIIKYILYPNLTRIHFIFAGIPMEYIAIVLIMLLWLYALQRLLHIVVKVLLVGLRLLIQFLVLFRSLPTGPSLPFRGRCCQAIPLSSAATSLEVARRIAGGEASGPRPGRWLWLGQDVGYGGYLLVSTPIGKQSALQIVGKYLLRYLILAGQLALVQLEAWTGIGVRTGVGIGAWNYLQLITEHEQVCCAISLPLTWTGNNNYIKCGTHVVGGVLESN